MGSQGDMLLRMLEPAVRPGPLPATARAAQAPIESRSFESLLEEAQADPGAAGGAGEAGGASGGAEAPRPGLLEALGRLDRIENASLRDIIGGAEAGPAGGP